MGAAIAAGDYIAATDMPPNAVRGRYHGSRYRRRRLYCGDRHAAERSEGAIPWESVRGFRVCARKEVTSFLVILQKEWSGRSSDMESELWFQSEMQDVMLQIVKWIS